MIIIRCDGCGKENHNGNPTLIGEGVTTEFFDPEIIHVPGIEQDLCRECLEKHENENGGISIEQIAISVEQLNEFIGGNY